MRIKDLFDIQYGNKEYHSTEGLLPGKTRLISSGAWERGTHGYYSITPRLSHVISVASTGTVGFACYHSDPCDVNDNCLVCTPKQCLTLRQMLFYADYISANRYRWTYGRQVTPEKLGRLTMQDKVPAWVETSRLPDFSPVVASFGREVVLPSTLDWREFRLKDLFQFERGDGPSLEWAETNPGTTPLVSASMFNNGVTAFVDMLPTHKGGCLTICANGPVGVTFYQPQDFVATQDVLVLRSQVSKPEPLLFISRVIEANSFRFNYGRKFTGLRTALSIRLPVTAKEEPDYDLMKLFIRGCRYSSILKTAYE